MKFNVSASLQTLHAVSPEGEIWHIGRKRASFLGLYGFHKNRDASSGHWQVTENKGLARKYRPVLYGRELRSPGLSGSRYTLFVSPLLDVKDVR
jgi:hypothetical protein